MLPGSPAWLYGIANLRGEIVSVLNLSKICGKKSVAVSPKSKVIVLKPNHGSSSIAFPVDRVSEIVTFNPENINLSDDPRFFGKAQHEKNFVNLLDTENLWSSLS